MIVVHKTIVKLSSSVMPLEKSSSAYKKGYKNGINSNHSQFGCVLIQLDR